MRPRATQIARRSLALVLAYLLALQVILTAWAVVVPAGAAGAQDPLCTTHLGGSAPTSDQPAQCPCGPMCLTGCCGSAPAPVAASALVVRTSVATLHPAPAPAPSRRIATHPEQARAPPVLA